ncbi:MAG: hypothetical protein CMH61_00065 [Nanoarchaeota archaeon]|nr:hypothetical protein [Nanoarchaeota archaeon]|tara:strand:+ start:630 stop:893 length:264 start_codon:yes stop_codon:yes gene_type:complete
MHLREQLLKHIPVELHRSVDVRGLLHKVKTLDVQTPHELIGQLNTEVSELQQFMDSHKGPSSLKLREMSTKLKVNKTFLDLSEKFLI